MSPKSVATLRATIARMRDEASERARPAVKAGSAPIRVMAQMVADLQAACREQGMPEDLIAGEVVNRTIGDVDLRRISPDLDGEEFVSLADDLGLALPGEVIGGRRSTGKTYRWIRESMQDFERQLLARRFDLRMYDLAGIGNPMLRDMLSHYACDQWGPTSSGADPSQSSAHGWHGHSFMRLCLQKAGGRRAQDRHHLPGTKLQCT